MNKRLIPFIEGLSFLTCLVLGILWIRNPSGPYEPPFAVISLILVATELYRRYGGISLRSKDIKTHSILDIDTKNTLFSRYVNNGNSKSGNMCLVFYGMSIVNNSGNPFTVKDVVLRYKFKNIEYSAISNVVLTGNIYSPLEKKNVNSLIIHKNGSNIVLMNFNNLRTEIGKLQILQDGSVLSGSSIFVLELKTIEELAELTNPELIIRDYSGNESIHPLKILDEWVENGKDSFVEHRTFSSNKDGKIIFA